LPAEANVAENNRLEELRRRIDRDPHPRHFALLAEELRQSGDLAEAIRVAREGIGRHPDDSGVRTSLGRALLDSGDATNARREFENVLRAAPENRLARRLLGQCLEALSDSDAQDREEGAVRAAEPDDEHLASRGQPVEWPLSHPSSAPGPSAGGPLSLAFPADEVGWSEEGARAERGEESSTYVDFSDEGTVTAAKVSPIIESLDNPDSIIGEALRLLAARVQKLHRDRKIGCLAVSSALPAEGKTTVALGLAVALAREENQRILLVEADLRRPALVSTLGVPPGGGLSEWLRGELPYVPVSRVEPGGFFLLSAGQRGLSRPEVLGSTRMDALLRAARRLFDLVLLDEVPIISVTDTVLIQELVDGFILVARSRQTPRDAIHEALARLRADKVLGFVLNDDDEFKGSYKAYAYRRYGMVGTPRKRSGGSDG
jgi:Mrp family chromosome partitioning ATPase